MRSGAFCEFGGFVIGVVPVFFIGVAHSHTGIYLTG